MQSQWRPWLTISLFVWSLLTCTIKKFWVYRYSSWIALFCCVFWTPVYHMIFLLCRFALIIRSVDKTKSLCKFYFSTDATPRFLYKPTPLIDKKISFLLIKKRTELVFAQTNARCMSWTPSSIPLLAQWPLAFPYSLYSVRTGGRRLTSYSTT